MAPRAPGRPPDFPEAQRLRHPPLKAPRWRSASTSRSSGCAAANRWSSGRSGPRMRRFGRSVAGRHPLNLPSLQGRGRGWVRASAFAATKPKRRPFDAACGVAQAGAEPALRYPPLTPHLQGGESQGQLVSGPATRSRQRPSTLPGASGRAMRAARVGMMSTVSTASGCSNPLIPRRQNRIGTRRS